MTELEGNEDPSEVSDRLLDLLDEIVDGLGLDAEVSVEESPGVITGLVEGTDVGLLIGRRGQTIDAVEHLAQRIVFPDGRSQTRIVIDADGYRESRAQGLREEADRAADEAIASGVPVELSAASASERRVVHEYLRERGDVETESVGEEPKRALVVSPKG